jgi:hypothetical protein
MLSPQSSHPRSDVTSPTRILGPNSASSKCTPRKLGESFDKRVEEPDSFMSAEIQNLKKIRAKNDRAKMDK